MGLDESLTTLQQLELAGARAELERWMEGARERACAGEAARARAELGPQEVRRIREAAQAADAPGALDLLRPQVAAGELAWEDVFRRSRQYGDAGAALRLAVLRRAMAEVEEHPLPTEDETADLRRRATGAPDPGAEGPGAADARGSRPGAADAGGARRSPRRQDGAGPGGR